MEPIHVLVTLNEGYLPQLSVMLTSLRGNNPEERLEVWLLHRGIPEERLQTLEAGLTRLEVGLHCIRVDETLFADAPVKRQYPQEMYYRLLAPSILPPELRRVLYIDPDVLVLNPVRPLWELDMEGKLFAAAAHTGKTELANNINKVRLKTENNYFNSGVLLIDLERGRDEIDPAELFDYAREHPNELLLPDQDILNILYGSRTLELDDAVWNYDARNYSNYLLRSGGVADTDWVARNTVFLHFCGAAKPWKHHYRHRFGILYKHYMAVAARYFGEEEIRRMVPPRRKHKAEQDAEL